MKLFSTYDSYSSFNIGKDIKRFIKATDKHIENGYLWFLDGSKSFIDLIRHSKTIISFQNNGIVEAMETSKQKVYTGWEIFIRKLKKRNKVGIIKKKA